MHCADFVDERKVHRGGAALTEDGRRNKNKRKRKWMRMRQRVLFYPEKDAL